uniref:Vegetative incompatibility protein 6 n=1 Tax=Cryphonectria parasitica TaxID=5116 RepID=G8H3P8_CRYPA|nr:vegetative incompatibility protein 6 [Cryphonectria parasitica]
MSLCRKCQAIPDTRICSGEHRVVVRHDSASIQKSVEDRCYICARVWNSLSEEQKAVCKRPTFEGIVYKMYTRDQSYGGSNAHSRPILAQLLCQPAKDDLYDCDDYNEVGGWWRNEAGAFAALNPSIFPVHEVVELSDSTNDSSSWSVVSTWIERCRSEHKTCSESYKTDWVPTRLVDVSQFEQGYVCVVTTSGLPQPRGHPYLALSHCWGKKRFLVFNEETKAKFESGVAISSLAQNFQDAIFTTHRLGYRYIWIDSLCIMQGSRKDWAEQAPLMNKVYKNAVLTLGAMASAEAEGGFFRSRDPDKIRPCPFRVNTESEGILDCLVVKSDFWETEVLHAPLSKRAWVVQERLLAPRSLYFGQSQLYWECQEAFACEVFPDGVPLAFVSEIADIEAVDVVPVKAFLRTAGALVNPTTDQEDAKLHETDLDRFYESPYQVWNEILHSYVRCGLTKPEDKFVAISGVVKDFADVVGDEYLAGLWRKNLIDGLLWHVQEEELTGLYVPATRVEPYRAPSWSWASVDSPHVRVQSRAHLTYDDSGYAAIDEVNLVPRNEEEKEEEEGGGGGGAPGPPAGELSHACLRARGYLIRTRRPPVRDRNALGSFGQFYPDTEALEGDVFFCWPLRERINDGDVSGNYLMGLVLGTHPEAAGEEEEGEQDADAATNRKRTSCDRCSGQRVFTRVGTFEIDHGDPLQYLSMKKPGNWADWGEEKDHLWFPEDAQPYEFIVV